MEEYIFSLTYVVSGPLVTNVFFLHSIVFLGTISDFLVLFCFVLLQK